MLISSIPLKSAWLARPEIIAQQLLPQGTLRYLYQ